MTTEKDERDPRLGMPAPDLLSFALQYHHRSVACSDVRTYYLDSTRGEDGVRNGTITHEVPDVIAQSVRGPADKARFRLLMVAIPAWVEERAGSMVLTPDEVAVRDRLARR